MGARIIVLPALAVLVAAGALTVSVPAQRAAPEPGAPLDAEALRFELANSMGMLRGLQQEDSIITLEHWAAGTATIGGQRFDLPEYRISLNYTVPGMRVDATRRAPDGRTQRSIEVVSGAAAWNEAAPGREATAAHASARERLVYLWTTPMGVVKAAYAAGSRVTVTASGPEAVLSFPLPAPVQDVTVHATVRRDAGLLAAPHETALPDLVGTYLVRVETVGPVATEMTYAEYGDWNWDDYRADIMLPRKIVRTHGDTTIELTTSHTNTYNPYVIMPVPENVRRQSGSQ